MKTILLLLLIVFFEVTGNACLSHGMRMVGDVSAVGPAAFWGAVVSMFTNPWVAIGVILLVGYFLSFLVALSRLELSYVLPMTAVGYVLTSLIAVLFLGETISANRWLGTALIGAGTILVSWSEHRRKTETR